MAFKRIPNQETKRNPYWFEDSKGNIISYINVSNKPNTSEFEIRTVKDGERKRIRFPLGSTKKISPERVLKIATSKRYWK